MNNDNPEQDEPIEGSVKAMQEILKERAVASVVMSESGAVIVQFGDKITMFGSENSASLAANLLSLIAETQKG